LLFGVDVATFLAMVESAARAQRLAALDRAAPRTPTRTQAGGPGWVYACLLVQLGCALLLLVQALTPVRVVIRSAALGASLAFLFIVPGRTKHWGTVRGLGVAALTIITLATLNPLGGTPLSVVAHWAFHLAVMAPLFWIGRLEIPRGTIQRVLLIIWGYHTLGAIVGMLQVIFPGRFQPITLSMKENQHLLIQLSSGEWMLRPAGLSDTPGGAGSQGMYAALFGSGVVMVRPFRYARVAGIASIGIGLVCIYLSQVRSVLVMLVICFIMLTVLLLISGRTTRATTFLVMIGIIAVVGFYFALDLGGDMMTRRLSSLVAADPGQVYYANRGRLLEHTMNEHLPRYPLGAGLGHWGMINAYFGSVEQEIGAEIQITGWILDAGIPLLIVYPAAVVGAVLYACRASQLPGNTDAIWASVVAAYGVGAIAICFSYPLFMGTGGVEFWLVNAVLMQQIPLRSRPPP
jgi:hypothetical protein